MIGERIKKLRVGFGFSQEEFAKKIGMSQSTLWKIEKGTSRKVKREWLEKIELALDLEKNSLKEALKPKPIVLEKELFFPNQIKSYRKQKNMTQHEFGELVGITQSVVSDIENGGRVQLDVLAKINTLLGTKTEFPLEGTLRIACYDLEGNLLEVVEGLSYKDIAEKLRLRSQDITDCITGRHKQSRGYQFKLVKDNGPVWNTIGDLSNANRRQEPFFKIYKGRIVSMYDTLEEAERRSGVNASTISRCLSGESGGSVYSWVKASKVFEKPLDGSILVSQEELKKLKSLGIDLEKILKNEKH
jgi:transcriptional regulator with XRE-family HTH domain